MLLYTKLNFDQFSLLTSKQTSKQESEPSWARLGWAGFVAQPSCAGCGWAWLGESGGKDMGLLFFKANPKNRSMASQALACGVSYTL